MTYGRTAKLGKEDARKCLERGVKSQNISLVVWHMSKIFMLLSFVC